MQDGTAATKGTANMTGSPIKLSVFKDSARGQLISILDGISGPKLLVIDSIISGPIGMVADAKSLKEHGVDRIVYLESGRMTSEQPNLVYLVSPQVSNMHCIAEHFHWLNQQKSRAPKNFFVYFVSRKTMICERVLEKTGLYGKINIGELQLDLIPFDDDVLSLELDDSYKECFLEHNPTSLYYVARSLMKLQSVFGVIGNIKGKGNAARMVADMMLRMRRELDIEEEAKVPEIDDLILVDRHTDMVTPMCTQYTYEGLIDEMYSIKHGMVSLDGEVLRKEPGKKSLHPLNSTDTIFNDIRNFNIGVLRPYINKRAQEIDQYYKKRHEQQTLGQIRDYVKKLSTYQAEHQSLLIHTSIAQLITKQIKEAEFRNRERAERDIIAGFGSGLQYIEECISKQDPILKVLRLLVLNSLTNNGLKPKAYSFFKKEILQTYGNEYLMTLCQLEQLGLFIPQTSKSIYPAIRKQFKLIDNEPNLAEPTDIGFVYSGMAPVSIRIVEATASTSSWQNIQEPLKMLPGAQFEEKQEIPEGIRQLSEDRTQGRRNRVTLVFFIGGITYAEISAIRQLHTLENGTRDFIIATTAFINGNSLLKTLVVPAGNITK